MGDRRLKRESIDVVERRIKVQQIRGQARAEQISSGSPPPYVFISHHHHHLSILRPPCFLPQAISSRPATSSLSFRGRPQLLKISIVCDLMYRIRAYFVWNTRAARSIISQTPVNHQVPSHLGCEDAFHICIYVPRLGSYSRSCDCRTVFPMIQWQIFCLRSASFWGDLVRVVPMKSP